ncbi:hypothetical protein ACTU3I_16520 [Microbacterium sp. RD1]|uniref:hypothetical protein n=1 Tax=Microbacterium sp. RD1 TaxID=3457313 RepID=UPI003FA580C7
MTTRASRATAAAAMLALLLLPLAACSAGASTDDDAATTTDETTAPADDGATASGDLFGCTDGILTYISDKGYPNAEPVDPATLEIPETAFDLTPDCYVVDDYDGAPRYAAFWATDPQGVLSTLGAALDAGGWVQSDEYGPLVWWRDGDDPLSAEHSLSAAPQPIDGVETLWASW